MKLGLCTIAFKKRPLEEVLDIAADYNFDGVEIWGKEPHMPEKFDENYVKEVKNMAVNRGLEIVAFGSYINPFMEDYQRRAESAVNITHGLGAKIIRVWSNGSSSKAISTEERRMIGFRLVGICQWAQFRDITVATEMHSNNYTDSSDTILELISNVALPNLRTYYQPLFVRDKEDYYEALEKIAPYVVNVHAQNAKLENGKYKSCALAEGEVDYVQIVEILESFNYEGYLEIEFVHGEDKLEALKKDRDYLASLIGID